MFSAHDFNATKRKFQKPNILRKKPKLSKVKVNESPVESPAFQSLLKNNNCTSTQGLVHKNGSTDLSQTKKEVHSIVLKTNIKDNGCVKELSTEHSSMNCFEKCVQACGEERRNNEKLINVESFLNAGITTQNMTASISQKDESLIKPKLCLDLINNPIDKISSSSDGSQTIFAQKVGVRSAVPLAVVSSVQAPITSCSVSTGTTPAQFVSIDSLINMSNKLRCDEQNCNKGFWTEQRLKKHKESHKKPAGNRPPSQLPIECPVKKAKEDGLEESCGKIFLIREELVKHINNDHTVDEAPYRCEACGRRFFWATGLRAHAAAQCSRVALTCSWPGCSRVFRQPCRLREHSRAHTGDRPYICRFPNCSWAFRSASKLLRHARRHTGDRRHACTLCGRAFLRREHLRDHTLRKHAADMHGQSTKPHPCPREDCEQRFSNMNTLYTHMKKVHKENNESNAPTVAVTIITSGDMMASIMVNSDVCNSEENTTSSIIESECEVEGQAARTHCPWPLRATPVYDQCSPTIQPLDDESPMEPLEGSESNVYTVRSDLFLHGNVLINEDNEFIVSRDYAIGEQAEGESEGLIDAHPTIDLMQEELMYADAPVDESSFRVFLLNGEELT